MKCSCKSRIWLLPIPLALSILDASVTLINQSAAYWDGDYSRVNEMAPAFNWMLRQHPLVFVAGDMAYMGICIALILFLPRLFGRAVALAMIIAHCWGAGGWITDFMLPDPWRYPVVSAMFFAFAVGFAWCLGMESRCQVSGVRCQ